jgi:hypothetical protein
MKRIVYERFDGTLGLNCFLLECGEIAVGDEVYLEHGRANTLPSLGGGVQI